MVFALRCDERLRDGASADAETTIGVSPNTRFRTLLRDVARAVHGRGNARARELRSMSDDALRERVHVALVIPSDRGGNAKRLTIDDATNFAKIVSSHAPRGRGREREAYVLVSLRVGKLERKAAAAARSAGSKRADGRGGEGKLASSSVSVIPVAKGASGEATEAKKSTPPPSPGAKPSTTWANKVGGGARSVSPGRSPGGGNGSTGRRSLGPLTSQARRTARREKERTATTSANVDARDDVVAHFAQSKLRDPVVFPAFRRSTYGAIGDPLIPTLRRDALTAASSRSRPR